MVQYVLSAHDLYQLVRKLSGISELHKAAVSCQSHLPTSQGVSHLNPGVCE